MGREKSEKWWKALAFMLCEEVRKVERVKSEHPNSFVCGEKVGINGEIKRERRE
jgi:hypothetical protein